MTDASFWSGCIRSRQDAASEKVEVREGTRFKETQSLRSRILMKMPLQVLMKRKKSELGMWGMDKLVYI